MRLTDELNSAEAALMVWRSPPGKKLQNVLSALRRREGADGAVHCWSAFSSTSPAHSASWTKWTGPLDESNIGRFTELIKDMRCRTQFIIIRTAEEMCRLRR